MTKKIVVLFVALGFLMAGVPVGARPVLVAANVKPSGQNVVIPGTAVQVADHVFSLGTAVDPASGKIVEGYAIIHYKRGYHHRPGHTRGGPGNGNGNTSTCFSFFAKGAKWKTDEPWVVNPANLDGLTGSFVFSNLTDDITKWEGAADFNILGDGSVTSATLVADTVSPDNVNEVYFADISSEGAIAITIVWGIFRGPPFARELVEWDMVFDDVDFDWSSTGEAGKMDFENIATHELGHSIGLGHPDDSCTEETMYRFADFGETKKQTLEAGDIAGASELY